MPNPPFGTELLDSFGSVEAGMNGGIAPALVPSNQLTYAENVTVRGAYAKPRPPHKTVQLTPGGALMLKAALASGAFQGACDFVPEQGPGLGNLTILVAIAGRLYQIILSDTPATVRQIFIGTDPIIFSPNAPQVWMWQTEKWVIGQDGMGTDPLIFDNIIARRSMWRQEDLGIVAAGSPVAPAIGDTITIPLTANYTGPENVVVTICDAQWQIIGGSAGTPGAYEVTLQNCGDNGSGGNPPADTELIVNPALAALVVRGTGSCVNVSVDSIGVVGGNIAYYSGGTITGITIDRPWPGKKTDKVRFGNDSLIYDVNSFNTIPANSATGWTPDGSGPVIPQSCPEHDLFIDGSGYSIAGCTAIIRTNANLPPAYTVGVLKEGFSIPAQGSNVTVKLTAPFTAPIGQIVLINGKTYIVKSIGSQAPAVPSVLAKNLNQTPGTAVNAGCHLLTIPEIRPGRMGVYGRGRNWYSLVDVRFFRATDLIGSASGTAAENYRDAVLKESMNTYLAEGGNFVVPGNIGPITAMRFTATLDVSLGQGPLQVFTSTSAFSCDAPVDNTVWQDITNPILTQSLIGTGSESHWATISMNSDLIFRSSVIGLSSLILARREFNTWGNVPISREVQPLIETDDATQLAFNSAANFDNRYLIATGGVRVDAGVYHPNLIALNADPLSSLRGKEPSVYDGVWKGLNILQLIQGRLFNRERAFALTLNDGLTDIGLVELLQESEGIYDDGQMIHSEIQIPPRFRYKPGDPLARTLKRLADGEIYVDELIGLVTFEVFYKPDQHPNWIPWFSWVEYSPDGKSFRPRMGLGEPSSTPCDPITNRPYREAFTFQVKIVMTGHCRILGALFKANTVPQVMFAPQRCDTPQLPVISMSSISTNLCINEPYTAQINISGLTEGEVSWEIISGQIPIGLTFNGGTLSYSQAATITGIPTQRGVFNFTVRASHGGIVEDQAIQLVVIEILNTAAFHVELGIPYDSEFLARPGIPTNWTLVSGVLPPGLVLQPNGIFGGIPIGVPASWRFVVEVTSNVFGQTHSCQKEFLCEVIAAGDYSPRTCIPDLLDWTVPAGKYVDLVADNGLLPANVAGNGSLLQMSGSCFNYHGVIDSKATFVIAPGKIYKLSVRAGGNGKASLPPEAGFGNGLNRLELKVTNTTFDQVININRTDPLTWFEFSFIGNAVARIEIASLDPSGIVTVPNPDTSGYGAWLKEVKLENTTDSIIMFDSVF